ncbi:uncharacterized protein LOC128566978 [Nycticebus coucang]|uniref:uncharacterized protein LOC128566978 n=1 Tax=Nycticebus coucang TaxID=9470 RepID=UPI00234D6C0E|nr:uncharacterized protein LOC128566978 [Nycticebus coucang]
MPWAYCGAHHLGQDEVKEHSLHGARTRLDRLRLRSAVVQMSKIYCGQKADTPGSSRTGECEPGQESAGSFGGSSNPNAITHALPRSAMTPTLTSEMQIPGPSQTNESEMLVVLPRSPVSASPLEVLHPLMFEDRPLHQMYWGSLRECEEAEACVPLRRKVCGGRMSIDVHALKKKLSRAACDPVTCAILGSLLLYVSGHQDGPPGAGGSRPRRQPEAQETVRRPTRFQLLQAKFLGTGREPPLKRTREVGRLILKDRHGPSRSLVSATISKLLDKVQGRAGGLSQGPPSEKPRWGSPAGKSTVKNILKKFLAAEEKAAKEREASEKPPAQGLKAPRGLLPKITGRNSVLSRLREKFEQSGCLCSEVGVLPLRTDTRKKKNLQRRKMHRPEVRVLHTATMASTCVRTPPAWFLACTADPLPAFSIATITCGPRSWLSHCTKISHSDTRHHPQGETRLLPDTGEAEPGGDKAHGKGPLQKEPKEQPEPSRPGTVAQRGSHTAVHVPLPCAGLGQVSRLDSPHAPGHMPALSPLELATPEGASSARDDRTVGSTAGSAVDSTREVGGVRAAGSAGPPGEGAAAVPEITMTVCSSEDEMEIVMPNSERDPFFATQKYFPEQKGPEHIPPLYMPAVQAAWRAQPAVEPPRITMQRPLVHVMPLGPASLYNTSPCKDTPSCVLGGESAVENAHIVFPTVTENKGVRRDAEEPREPVMTPAGLEASSTQGAQANLNSAPLRDAARADSSTPATVTVLRPPKNPPGGKENKYSFENSNYLKGHKGVARENISEPHGELHQLPESNAAPKHNKATWSDDPTAWKTNPSGTSGSQLSLSASKGNMMGAPVLLAAPSRECVKSEGFTTPDSSLPHKKEHQRPQLAGPVQPLMIAEGNASPEFGKNRLSSSDEQPKPSIKGLSKMTGADSMLGHTSVSPGDGQHPEYNVDEERCGQPATSLCVAEGSSIMGQRLPGEPSHLHLRAQSGSAEHRGESSSPAGQAPHTEGAAHPSRLGASRKLAARGAHTAVGGNEARAMGADPAGHSTGARGQCPAGWSLRLARPQSSPSVPQQAIQSEKWLPSWAELAHPPPMEPSTEGDIQQAGRAQAHKPPDLPAPQVPVWGTLKAQSLGCVAQGSPLAQADLGGQESPQDPEKTASGYSRTQQTPQLHGHGGSTALLGLQVVQSVAKELQTQLPSAQNPDAWVERPCQHGDKGWACPPGPWVEQVRSLGQGQGTWAAENPVTLGGSPAGTGSLVAQGQTQGQKQGQVQRHSQGQVQEQIQGQPQGQVQRQVQRQTQGQPQGQVQGQVQGQPQRQVQKQPQGQAQRQPQGQAQGQVQGQPQGQVQKQPQGQTQGQVQGQPQRQVQKQPQGQAQRQPQGQAQGQVQGQPQGQVQKQPQGQVQEQPQGQAQGQVQKQPQGQVQEQPQGQAQGQVQKQPQGQAQRQPQGQVQGQPQGQVQKQPQRQAQGQVQGQAQEQVQKQPQGQAQGQVQGQPQGQAQEQVQEQPQGQAQGQVQKQPQGQVQEQPQGQAQGQVQKQPQGQAQRQPQRQAQGQPQGQMQKQPQGQAQGQVQKQPQGQAQGQVQKQPQGQAQGQVQRQPQGQAQGQVQRQPQGQAQGQVQGQPQKQVQKQPQGQPQEQVQRQMQSQAEGWVQGQPQGQVKGQIQEQMQGQVQGQPQDQVQEQPQDQVQGQPQDQVQGQPEEQAQVQVQGKVQGQPQGWVQGQVQTQLQGQPQGQVRGQARVSGMAPQAWEQPIISEAGGTPPAGGSERWVTRPPEKGRQRDPAAKCLPQESQRPQGKSSRASAREPADGPAMPMSGAGSCQGNWALCQDGIQSKPGAERGLGGEVEAPEHEHHRRTLSLAKYRAQSFSDQRAFDLSFRPMSLRANDTFNLPK